jgi:hypothetical protein
VVDDEPLGDAEFTMDSVLPVKDPKVRNSYSFGQLVGWLDLGVHPNNTLPCIGTINIIRFFLYFNNQYDDTL